MAKIRAPGVKMGPYFGKMWYKNGSTFNTLEARLYQNQTREPHRIWVSWGLTFNKLTRNIPVPMKIHIIRIFLVNSAIYSDRGAFSVIESEVPSFAASATSSHTHIGAVGNIEGAVTFLFRYDAWLL